MFDGRSAEHGYKRRQSWLVTRKKAGKPEIFVSENASFTRTKDLWQDVGTESRFSRTISAHRGSPLSFFKVSIHSKTFPDACYSEQGSLTSSHSRWLRADI